MIKLVQLLSAGFCMHPEVMTYRTGRLKACEFPSGFALIIHNRYGAILFDTGYSEHFRQETKSFPNSLYASLTPINLQDTEQARVQIQKFGVTTNDVRYVFVSHFHADHFSALKDFPRAKIICSRQAWSAVKGLKGTKALLNGFLPGLLPKDIEQRLLFVEVLQETKASPLFNAFGRRWDLFDDGSITIVKLPGHSIGQIGVILDYGDSPLFLIADAAWSQKAVETCTPPPTITTNFLGNTRQYLETLNSLNSVWRSKQAVIVPSHCTLSPQRMVAKL